MAIKVRYKNFDQLSFTDILVYSKLPEHPFWSNVEKSIDFSFADKLCAVLYSGKGQHPYAPSLKLKIHLVQNYEGVSDRKVEEKIIGDLFIKRFLQLPVDFFGFDHSTIGLDRERMGEAMFHACHLYILAQMYSLGLWGDKSEQWVIDSFPVDVHMVRRGSYRLIRHAVVRLVQHLRKQAPKPVREAAQSLPLDALGTRLNSKTPTVDVLLAYSKLVAQAYGLLQWFHNENIVPMLSEWKSYARSQELQAILKRILEENSRPIDPDERKKTGLPDEIQFEKIPRNQRPKDRIESAVDPEVRTGWKGKKKNTGYKIQNLCTTDGVILNARVVSAIEHDQDAVADMVGTIQHLFRQSPTALLGDAAYGHGRHRTQLAMQGIHVIAPVQETHNPQKLLPSSLFTYDANNDVYICPNGEQSVRKRHSPQNEGTQYHFAKKTCLACPIYNECTTNKNGRSIFRSDYAQLYEEAKIFNESIAGQAELKKRLIVERKNHELKNDSTLGLNNTKSKTSLQIRTTCSTMIVNLKYLVRRLHNPKPGFLRRARTAPQ